MGAKHILVVEDEEVIRETLRFNLVREGYQVSQAANGIEALEKARELRPDLIVLDLMLPELGGLEVCRILRQETTTPVLVLSARDSELDKIVGLRVGADDYMTKPFSLAELTARVMALLRRAQPNAEERGVHVRWLREKFEPFEALPFRITTVYGVGYRLDRILEPSEPAAPGVAVIGRR